MKFVIKVFDPALDTAKAKVQALALLCHVVDKCGPQIHQLIERQLSCAFTCRTLTLVALATTITPLTFNLFSECHHLSNLMGDRSARNGSANTSAY